jgi:hypothetical protein
MEEVNSRLGSKHGQRNSANLSAAPPITQDKVSVFVVSAMSCCMNSRLKKTCSGNLEHGKRSCSWRFVSLDQARIRHLRNCGSRNNIVKEAAGNLFLVLFSPSALVDSALACLQEAELKLQKMGHKLTQGEVLLKEIAEGTGTEGGVTATVSAEAMSAREAKMLKKKAKEAIRAAGVQELHDKSEV